MADSPMPEPRMFDLGDVLTVSSGRLLSERGMDGLYDILHFMTGAPVFTHQIPRVLPIAKIAMLEQHPQLRDLDRETVISRANFKLWLSAQRRIFGDQLLVAPLVHLTRIDPVVEAELLFGKERVLTVNPSRSDA